MKIAHRIGSVQPIARRVASSTSSKPIPAIQKSIGFSLPARSPSNVPSIQNACSMRSLCTNTYPNVIAVAITKAQSSTCTGTFDSQRGIVGRERNTSIKPNMPNNARLGCSSNRLMLTAVSTNTDSATAKTL